MADWRALVPTDIVACGGWTRPCEELFQTLVARVPAALLTLIESEAMAPAELTHALEIVGQIGDARVRALLLEHLDHASPLVREGAVYGLAKQLSPEARMRLGWIALHDPSPGVRAAAQEIVDDR